MLALGTFLWVGFLVFFAWRRAVGDFEGNKKKLNDPATRPDYISRLRQPKYATLYQGALHRTLLAIDWAFGGPKPFRGDGFVLCVAISFIYSLFGFLFAWALGGPGQIGNTPLLPDNWNVGHRIVFTAALVTVCVALYLFTANILKIIQTLASWLKRLIDPSRNTKFLLIAALAGVEAGAIFFVGRDFVLLGLFLWCFLFLGPWLANALLFGGVSIGVLAALFSGVANNGTHRFVTAIAILALIALGGSRGTQAVAAMLQSCYKERLGLPERLTGLLAFASVGAAGAAAFVCGAGRAYAKIVGPELDISLRNAFGFTSDSTTLVSVVAALGLLGGLLAAVLGQGAVFLGGFACAFLTLLVLGTAFDADHQLYYFFSSPLVGIALINLLLFFIILPIVNAFWDWLAWEFSRLLGRRLSKNVTLASIALHILCATVIGIVLLLGLTASASWSIALFNKWMLANNQIAPLLIKDFVDTAMNHPLSANGFWVTIMVFSTLLPTVIYLAFIVFAIFVVWTPESLRLQLADQLANTSPPSDVDRVAWYFTLLPLFGFLTVALLCWLAFVALNELGVPFSGILLGIVHWSSS